MDELPKYRGNFWKLKELRNYANNHLLDTLYKKKDAINKLMNDSNELRLKRRKEKEEKLNRPIPKSDYGDRPPKAVKGKDGTKFNTWI